MSFAIFGGGVSGITAAIYLRRFGYKGKITLFESSERLGGWINTYKSLNGTLYELGPRTLRARGNSGYNTLNLAESLGLNEYTVSVSYNHPSARNRLIKVDGKLHRLPNSFQDAFRKIPPFSKPIISHLLNDFMNTKVISNDESIYSFTQRRFGSEIANFIVDPLCRGIFAGNAKDISINSFAKYIYDCEQNHGSIFLGMLFGKLNTEKLDKTLDCKLVNQSKSEKWSVWSLVGGLQTLVDKIESEIEKSDIEILKNTEILNLSYNGKEIIINSKDQIFIADKAISCLPARNLKMAFKNYNKDLYTLLHDIPFVSVAIVNLEFSVDIIKEPAFGYLVPSSEKCQVLGVIFDTVSLPQEGKTILTVMMGGYWFQEVFGNNPSEEQILDIALDEVKNTFKISELPESYKVSILKNCIPQYTVGHSERVENITKLLRNLNIPLGLAGNSYNGIGVNDAIYSSKKVTQSMIY